MRDLPYYANMRDGELMRIRRARAYTGRLAFVLVGMALLAVLLIVTAVRAEDKLRADLTLYHQFRSMK